MMRALLEQVVTVAQAYRVRGRSVAHPAEWDALCAALDALEKAKAHICPCCEGEKEESIASGTCTDCDGSGHMLIYRPRDTTQTNGRTEVRVSISHYTKDPRRVIVYEHVNGAMRWEVDRSELSHFVTK